MNSPIMLNTNKCAKKIYALNYAAFYSAVMALNATDTFAFRLEGDCVKTLTNNKVTLSAVGVGARTGTNRIDIIFEAGGSAIYSGRIDLSTSSTTIVALYRATMTSV